MKYFSLLLISLLTLVSCTKPEIDLSEHTVTVNPFKLAPLTAIVHFTDKKAKPKNIEEIYIKVLGKTDASGNPGISIVDTLYPHSEAFKKFFFDINKDRIFQNTVITAKDQIEVPVLGLYPNYANKVFIQLKAGTTISSDTITIETKGMPDDTLKIEILECKPELMEPGQVTWMTADAYKYDVMIDAKGALRWFIDAEGLSDLRVLHNGNLLIRSWWAENNFGEYTMLGDTVNRWPLSEKYLNHHDIFELPDGNFLVPVTRDRNKGDGTVQDVLIEIDRQTGDILHELDLYKLMDIDNLKEVWHIENVWFKNRFLKGGAGDWFHMNSVCYDTVHDEIIISGKHGGVVKVAGFAAADSLRKLVWYMPNHDQYAFYAKHKATKDILLTAVDSAGVPYKDQSLRHPDFHWTKFQHHPTITQQTEDELQYIIFNNVYAKNRSAIVEYRVNEQYLTVQEVWQFGGDRYRLFSPAWAGVPLLPQTGNRLMVTTFRSPKVEVTEDKEIAFKFTLKSKNFAPKWYRGGRINLYPHKGEK